MLLQVWLPFGLGLLAIAAVAVLVVLAALRSSPVVSQASSVSVILMVVPVIIMGIFSFSLIVLTIYLAAKLTGKISPAARAVHGFLAVLEHRTDRIANGAAAPFIKIRSILAAAGSLVHRKR